jgi:hypothetical protein
MSALASTLSGCQLGVQVVLSIACLNGSFTTGSGSVGCWTLAGRLVPRLLGWWLNGFGAGGAGSDMDGLDRGHRNIPLEKLVSQMNARRENVVTAVAFGALVLAIRVVYLIHSHFSIR